MSVESTWIMFVLTNLIGGCMIFVTLYLLQPKKSRKIITTYSHHNKQEEKGPVLELPDGVTLPSKKDPA